MPFVSRARKEEKSIRRNAMDLIKHDPLSTRNPLGFEGSGTSTYCNKKQCTNAPPFSNVPKYDHTTIGRYCSSYSISMISTKQEDESRASLINYEKQQCHHDDETASTSAMSSSVLDTFSESSSSRRSVVPLSTAGHVQESASCCTTSGRIPILYEDEEEERSKADDRDGDDNGRNHDQHRPEFSTIEFNREKNGADNVNHERSDVLLTSRTWSSRILRDVLSSKVFSSASKEEEEEQSELEFHKKITEALKKREESNLHNLLSWPVSSLDNQLEDEEEQESQMMRLRVLEDEQVQRKRVLETTKGDEQGDSSLVDLLSWWHSTTLYHQSRISSLVEGDDIPTNNIWYSY